MTTENRLLNLEKRVSYQESIHPDITMTDAGLVHGIFQIMPFLISAVILSVIISVAVTKKIVVQKQ